MHLSGVELKPSTLINIMSSYSENSKLFRVAKPMVELVVRRTALLAESLFMLTKTS